MAPEVLVGDATAEKPLGDPTVEVIFGVPLGVNLGVIYGVTENLCTASLEAVGQTMSLEFNIDKSIMCMNKKKI